MLYPRISLRLEDLVEAAKISSDQRKILKFLDDFIKDQKLVWKRSFDPDDVDAANIAYVTVDQGCPLLLTLDRLPASWSGRKYLWNPRSETFRPRRAYSIRSGIYYSATVRSIGRERHGHRWYKFSKPQKCLTW